jgi:hypothetical protein
VRIVRDLLFAWLLTWAAALLVAVGWTAVAGGGPAQRVPAAAALVGLLVVLSSDGHTMPGPRYFAYADRFSRPGEERTGRSRRTSGGLTPLGRALMVGLPTFALATVLVAVS